MRICTEPYPSVSPHAYHLNWTDAGMVQVYVDGRLVRGPWILADDVEGVVVVCVVAGLPSTLEYRGRVEIQCPLELRVAATLWLEDHRTPALD